MVKLNCIKTKQPYTSYQKRIYEHILVQRGTPKWHTTYKIRVAFEKDINHFKYSYWVVDRKTQNEQTFHVDLFLAGITRLITVIVADKIHKHEYIRSLKPLIA